MLPDNDDLLNQLSCELGLSDFMDDGSSILADGRTGANLYDQFLSSSENDEHALFNELIYSDGNSISHTEAFTKSRLKNLVPFLTYGLALLNKSNPLLCS